MDIDSTKQVEKPRVPETGQEPAPPKTNGAAPQSHLEVAYAVFLRWFGDDYDLDLLDAVLSTAACDKIAGDPLS
jgi:hypothetical protein